MTSGAVAVGNSYAAATVMELHGLRFVLALLVGIIVGALCIWIVRAVSNKIFNRVESRLAKESPAAPREIESISRTVYIGAFLWLIVAGVAGFELTAVFARWIAASG